VRAAWLTGPCRKIVAGVWERMVEVAGTTVDQAEGICSKASPIVLLIYFMIISGEPFPCITVRAWIHKIWGRGSMYLTFHVRSPHTALEPGVC